MLVYNDLLQSTMKTTQRWKKIEDNAKLFLLCYVHGFEKFSSDL